jgi:glycosyltransferase involved in cell wall biosynthesis
MKNLPLVSIALCTYNGEKFISQQLESILKQSYPNIEIVVVDDCSTDNTFSILEDYADKNDKIKLTRNDKNLGFIGNFEKALRLSQGTYIAFSDQDDVWDVEKIKTQVENIEGNKLIYHDSVFIDSEGNSLKTRISDLKKMYEGGDPRAFLFNNCVSGHSILMEKSLVDEILPFPVDIFYDWWIAFVALNKGSIKFLPKTFVSYRKHNHSITNENLTLNKNNGIISLALQIDQFCNKVSGEKHGDFFRKIKKLIHSQNNKKPNLGLVFLMITNLDTLFFIKKKSRLSKINLILKNIFSNELRV